MDIESKVRSIVASASGKPGIEISNTTSFREDLKLTKSQLLEIGVDVDYEFKLGVSEGTLMLMDSVDEISRFISDRQPTLQRF